MYSNLNTKFRQTLIVLTSLILAALLSPQSLAASTMELATTDIDFFNQQQNRPTKIKFWYPRGSSKCQAKICLPEKQNNYPIAVISHGAFGSPNEMNWLGYALASQGLVVAGVAHFGESWVYGPENIDPSVAARFWQRPQDISFAIDSLSDKGLFNVPMNTDSVIMLGHSSGGFTSLAMAGANLEAGKSANYCASQQARNDKGCHYGKQRQQKAMDKDTLKRIGLLQAQMQDKRVAAVIALDPALGHAVSEQSLKGIQVPTLVVGSVDNDFLPYNIHAKNYAKHIEGASLVGIEQGAGHFAYIDECNSERQVNGVYLCKDREGVNRKVIQQQVLGHVLNFIHKNGLS